ncbi:trehalose-6-phosphate synthase [Microbacterium sp. NRRL B-14842]|uniref:trehalose-6-phosphate synthase n=1 Tax=Microbacterium sp. NRRL B-14842 TaxID=3162881 RepID=UPI003D2AF940
MKGSSIAVPDEGGSRTAIAKAFPISIDTAPYLELAAREDVRARAAEIRASLGNPKRILLGVDRLDYTKGIGHRIKAYGELLEDGRLDVEDVTLIQVASPSRERVDAYAHLRDEIELAVARINGDHDTVGHSAIRYLHQGYPREEMVALYLAADVMLVTALRDGMNLVAKEYVATRTGQPAASSCSASSPARRTSSARPVRVNPHDIAGLKGRDHGGGGDVPRRAGAAHALPPPPVLDNDVNAWSSSFLDALADVRRR